VCVKKEHARMEEDHIITSGEITLSRRSEVDNEIDIKKMMRDDADWFHLA
jgi:hypothetical protein